MPVPVNTNAQVQALVDEFVVKGGYRLQLDEVVVPVAVVSQLAAGEFPGAMGGDRLTAVNRQTFGLYNPAGSVVELLLDKVVINVAANVLVEYGFGGTILGAAVPNLAFKDMRNGNPPNGQVVEDDLAAIPVGGNSMGAIGMNGSVWWEHVYDPPILLGPNQQYWFQNLTNASAFSMFFEWREAPAR